MRSNLGSTALLCCLLVLLPALAWLSTTSNNIWQNRLIIPQLTQDIDLHTPLVTQGTYLPLHITSDTTLTPAQNPIILNETTTVDVGKTLTFAPGTEIFANEFSSLIVDGHLISQGTKTSLVKFNSNEQHPDNQVWGGMSFTTSGTGDLKYTQFQFASPAISCFPGSQVIVANSRIIGGSVGVFNQSDFCSVTSSQITGSRIGVMTQKIHPLLTDTVITARKESIHEIQ